MTAPRYSKDGTMSEVTSGVQMEKQSFKWTIENFDIVRQCKELVLGQKLKFKAGDSIGLSTSWEFFLDYCERGEQQESKVKWISLCLKLLKAPENLKPVAFGRRIQCKKADGSLYFAADIPFRVIKGPLEGWGWAEFIKADEALEDLPLVDGSLIIEAEFTLYAIKPQTCIQTDDVPAQVKAFEIRALQKLSQDLGQSQSEAGSKLVSVDKMEFPVNREILSARSPIFQRMFQSGMMEAVTGVVQIDDLSGKTVAVLLRYIMTGTLHEDWNSPEVIMELPYAAHKYELDLLVDFFDQILGSVCTIGNAKQLAVLANKLGMKKAEGDLLAFIKDKAAAAKSLEDLTTLMDTN